MDEIRIDRPQVYQFGDDIATVFNGPRFTPIYMRKLKTYRAALERLGWACTGVAWGDSRIVETWRPTWRTVARDAGVEVQSLNAKPPQLKK